MKKEELIKKIEALPAETEVCIFNYKKNLSEDIGDGSHAGIYPDFNVLMLNREDITKSSIPFAVLEFDEDGIY